MRAWGVPRAFTVGLVAATLLFAAAVAFLTFQGGSDQAGQAQIISMPGHPSGIATTPGRVWVAAQRSGAVWVLDSATGRPVGPPLRTGGTPGRLAVGGTGVWVADAARGVVIPVRWRPRPQAFEPIELGADVADVALAARAVWTVSSAEGVVRVLEPGADRAAHELPVGDNPVALAADERWVVAAVAGDGTLARIDARTRQVAGPPVRVGGVPVEVAISGGVAWVADARGAVTGVDLQRGATIGPAVAIGGRPVALAADGPDVYVLSRDELVHVEGREIRSRRQIGGEPAAVALDGRHVWVADAGSDRVVRVER